VTLDGLRIALAYPLLVAVSLAVLWLRRLADRLDGSTP